MSNNILTSTGIALVLAATAGAASFAFSTNATEASIDKALKERLPAAIEAHLNEQQQQQVQAAKEKALSGWAAAEKDVPEGRWIYGGLNAQFTLVEFSDLECPFCKRFHDTPKQLVDQSGGRVNWEWQHYPLPFHNPAAEAGAHAAECVGELAGNRAFWAFLDQWFMGSKLNGQGVEDMATVARNVGAPPAEFQACMDSGRHKEKVKTQMERGTAMGVSGTPATVVVDNLTGNKMLVSGAQPPQALLQAMKELVEQRDAPAGQNAPVAPQEAASATPEPQAQN